MICEYDAMQDKSSLIMGKSWGQRSDHNCYHSKGVASPLSSKYWYYVQPQFRLLWRSRQWQSQSEVGGGIYCIRQYTKVGQCFCQWKYSHKEVLRQENGTFSDLCPGLKWRYSVILNLHLPVARGHIVLFYEIPTVTIPISFSIKIEHWLSVLEIANRALGRRCCSWEQNEFGCPL